MHKNLPHVVPDNLTVGASLLAKSHREHARAYKNIAAFRWVCQRKIIRTQTKIELN